jgi:hypothetical protein
MKKLIVFLLVIVAASSVMFTKAAHRNELVTGDMNNTKSFSENFQTTGEVSSASGPIITNVGLTIGNDGKKDFSYLRREGNEWVRVTRSKEGINILGKEPAPREQIPAGHTSCLFLPYVAHPVGSWPEAEMGKMML